MMSALANVTEAPAAAGNGVGNVGLAFGLTIGAGLATTVGAMRVWGGLLGSLEKFELHLDRERSDVGVWFNRHAEISIRARKLFSSFGMLVREVGSDLRPVDTPEPPVSPMRRD